MKINGENEREEKVRKEENWRDEEGRRKKEITSFGVSVAALSVARCSRFVLNQIFFNFDQI